MNKDTAAFVASKRERKRPAKLKPVEATPKIPQDLQDQMGSIAAVADTFNLMQKAQLPYTTLKMVERLLPFWGKLYEQCVEKALEHPQAALVPQLKEELDKKNGKTTKTEA